MPLFLLENYGDGCDILLSYTRLTGVGINYERALFKKEGFDDKKDRIYL